MVPKRRFELLHIAALEPETSVSTNSTTSAVYIATFSYVVSLMTTPYDISELSEYAGCTLRNFSAAS